jgi:hypothetical protein
VGNRIGDFLSSLIVFIIGTLVFGWLFWMIGYGVLRTFTEPPVSTADWWGLVLGAVLMAFFVPMVIGGAAKMLRACYFPIVRPVVVSISGGKHENERLYHLLEWVFSSILFAGVCASLWYLAVWENGGKAPNLIPSVGNGEQD